MYICRVFLDCFITSGLYGIFFTSCKLRKSNDLAKKTSASFPKFWANEIIFLQYTRAVYFGVWKLRSVLEAKTANATFASLFVGYLKFCGFFWYKNGHSPSLPHIFTLRNSKIYRVNRSPLIQSWKKKNQTCTWAQLLFIHRTSPKQVSSFIRPYGYDYIHPHQIWCKICSKRTKASS